jgi:hypothetical protein
MSNLIATIRDFFRTTPYTGMDYRRKAGALRGVNIQLVRNHAFSYDVLNRAGQKMARRYLFSAAQNFGLVNADLETTRRQGS